MNEKDPHSGEARYEEVHKTYEGDGVVIHWQPRYCIHVGECFRGQPAVFDPERRPWIKAGEATADAIAETILRCPTGALHFERTDGGPQEPDGDQVKARPVKNGPLYVRGRMLVQSSDGSVSREDTRMALCRCGASENKPFCDGSHNIIGFRA